MEKLFYWIFILFSLLIHKIEFYSYLFVSFFIPSLFLIIYVILYFVIYFLYVIVLASLIKYLDIIYPVPLYLKILLILLFSVLFFKFLQVIKKRPRKRMICSLKKLRYKDYPNFGTKASNLGEVCSKNIPILDGIAVSKKLFFSFARYNKIDITSFKLVNSNAIDDIIDFSEKMKNLVMNGKFNYFQTIAIKKIYRLLQNLSKSSKGEETDFLIRSSFGKEDTLGSFLAGQFSSVVYSGDINQLKDGIKKCWASFWSVQAIVYRIEKRISHFPELSFFIQQKITPQYIGTACNINLSKCYEEEAVIDLISCEKVENLTEKTEVQTIFYNKIKNLFNLDLCGQKKKIAQILIKHLNSLENIFKNPIIIEWLFWEDKIYILQARKVFKDRKVETYISSGPVEIIPEALSPITLSLIKKVMPLGNIISLPFKQYIKREIKDENLVEIYKNYAFVNYGYLIKLKNELALRLDEILRLVILIFNFHKKVKTFITEFDFNASSLQNLDFERMSINDIFEKLLFINSYVNYYGLKHQLVTFHLFQVIYKLTEEYLIRRLGADLNAFYSLSLYQDDCFILKEMRQINSLVNEIKEKITDNQVSMEVLRELVSDGSVNQKWNAFKNEFGFLTEGSGIELSHPRIKEDDTILLNKLYLLLVNDETKCPHMQKNERTILKKLKDSFTGNNALRWDWFLFRIAFYYLKIYATLREDLKAKLLHGNFLMRMLLLKLARLEPLKGQLSSLDDIFFMEINDIEIILKGEKNNIKSKVVYEKEQFLVNEKQRPCDIYHKIDGQIVEESEEMFYSGDVIYGISGNVGIAEGKAKLVSSISDVKKVLKGDIVVSKKCMPWLSIFFDKASGIICDEGGSLSHLCLSAKEFKIPIVVGTHNASKIIDDGQNIVINGFKGIIKLKD